MDIVSAYQWAFTKIRDISPAVAHFERYPKVAHSDGHDATPDFSVLLKDGRAIVAEIANIALREESVDSLCRQLARYDALEHVPGPGGELVRAREVDVVFLTPIDDAADAARRVFTERLDAPDHVYAPRRRPVLVQFVRTEDRYVFQRWPDNTLNGVTADGEIAIDPIFDLKLRPDRFAEEKVQFAFMNDPVKPLYMATRLWTSVFPSKFWVADAKNEFTASVEQIAGVVRQMYGRCRSTEVKEALLVLAAAGLAVAVGKQWVVLRRNLKGDIPKRISDRIGSGAPARRPQAERPRTLAGDPQTLF